MKRLKLIILVLIFGGIILNAQQSDNLIDSRDLKTYKTVAIGNQVWMSENLNFEIQNSWTYQDSPENGVKYGRLYTWDEANKACPAGWHLPTDGEWKELEKFLGMSENELEKANEWRGTNQGSLLISDSTIGFKILMGGYRNPPANYNLIDLQAFFWTSSPDNESAWFRQFYVQNKQIFRKSRPKSWSFSVRCVEN